MKFTVSTSQLQKQLTIIGGVISNNPIVPILENFLMELENGMLTISASDLQTSMTTQLEVTSSDSGSIAVPAKILTDTLKSLSEQPLTIEVDEDSFVVEVHSANGRYKLAGENAMDFPKIPASADGNTINMPTEVLGEAISNTLFAVSSDELRPAMTGVFVELKSEDITFVATDGNRLIRYRRTDVGSTYVDSMIIPRKALGLLKGALPADASEIKIEFSKSNAFFSFNNTRLICRLIDERFPDYDNAIPVNNPNKMIVDKSVLLNTLKRIAIYANRTTHLIRLKMAQDELIISAEDLDFSNEANEKLPCQYTGEEMEIGFNAKFLIEMLSNIRTKEVKFEMSASNRAGLLMPSEMEENEDILMLLMPVMLNNYA
ncbi:MAG: DNA polymerase III subunit beta [Thermonemataceae bacterium]